MIEEMTKQQLKELARSGWRVYNWPLGGRDGWPQEYQFSALNEVDGDTVIRHIKLIEQ